MFELENRIKAYGPDADDDCEVPLTLAEARDIASKFQQCRTALRRIVSLDEKNVTKFAQQIAKDGLRGSHA